MVDMHLGTAGMVCSVGLTAASACAAMRAGIAKFDEVPYMDNQGKPIVGAKVPDMAFDLKREQRLVDMLAPAVSQCIVAEPHVPTVQTPLLLCLAEPRRPGGGAERADSLLEQLTDRLGLKFHPALSQVIRQGHTSAFEALRITRDLIQNGQTTQTLICGVDSYLNASSLLWLDRSSRLKTPANQHGLIPGEAAAAIWVHARRPARHALSVRGLGFGTEKAHVLSDEPLLGLGLAEAARSALDEAELGYHEIDLRLSDVTGEQYGFKELPLVEARLARVVRKQPQPIWHCADSIGDTGAAAGVAQMVIVRSAGTKNYLPGNNVICTAGNVEGLRATAVIRQLA